MDLFQQSLENLGEFGTVTQVNHPIVTAEGLPSVQHHELVVFENGDKGEVFSIDKDTISVILFSKNPIKAGVKIARTGKLLGIPVGKELLGCVIDPFGSPISTIRGFTTPKQEKPLEAFPLGISQRSRIKRPLKTGIAIVDMLIPIGKGQRELIIGDRKTGKSSLLLNTIKTQVLQGAIGIYAAIGRKKSDIRKLEEYFKKEGIFDRVIIVAASSYDSLTHIYFAPYTAMTIAEYFRDLGQDTIVVLDDLSAHAKFYREISLVAKNFPGRDSYPGDIFYTHARLLERAGSFIYPKKGEVSITCLPIVETVEGDLTGYIQTNVMSMTDGHIFFDSNAYYQGRRPAINISLSVTRVGKQIQQPVERDINRELISFLTLYERMQNLSHFGAELTDRIKTILRNGERIYEFFNQPYNLSLPSEVQLVFFCLLWLGFLDSIPLPLQDMRLELYTAAQDPKTKTNLTQLTSAATSFNDLLRRVSMQKDALILLCQSKPKSQAK